MFPAETVLLLWQFILTLRVDTGVHGGSRKQFSSQIQCQNRQFMQLHGLLASSTTGRLLQRRRNNCIHDSLLQAG